MGFDSEEQAIRAVGEAVGLRTIDLAATKIDLALLQDFPIKLIHRHGIFPICLEEDSLVVATSDAFDLHALDAVSAAVGLSVAPVLAIPDELARLIKSHLGVGAETVDGLIAQDEGRQEAVEVLDEIEWDQSEASEMAQQASVVRLVNEILTEAVETRASDIHLEAQATGMKIRYRIDGVLQKQPMPSAMNRFQAAIVSRLKIMAKLNIAEKRVPQDGRIKLKVSGREVDIRVSIIPMAHGEGIVMRVLDKDRMQFSLRGLGMDEDTYQRFGRMIKLPHGIVLVTGPTGSGKTTTLYSALSEIKSEDTKIITTEDPIEYQLDGINQIQVHPKVGLTFTTSLRSILRHDPDVVLVGEIRDLETADFLELQEELKGRLIGAMSYPAFLAVAGFIVTTVLVVFFVPKFATLFTRLEQQGGGLPAATIALLWISDTLGHYGIFLAAGITGMVLWARRAARSKRGRMFVDRWKLKIPLAGKVFHGYAVSRFCRVLGTMLRNGVPLLGALRISSDSTGNAVLAQAIRRSGENISSGESLSRPLADCGLIPRPVMAMISVAEESNNLEEVLINIADGIDRKNARQLDIMVRLVEPILLLIMGGIIMFVLVALLLPVFEMSASMG